MNTTEQIMFSYNVELFKTALRLLYLGFKNDRLFQEATFGMMFATQGVPVMLVITTTINNTRYVDKIMIQRT